MSLNIYSIAGAVKGFFKKPEQIKNVTIQDDVTTGSIIKRRGTPINKDLTFPGTVNPEVTKALYNNTYPGCKLGAHLAKNPIDIPLAFMGVPHFGPDKKTLNSFWKKFFVRYNDRLIKAKQDNQRISSRDGTSWIYPRFDSTKGFVVWDFLPPANKFYVDVDTNELVGVEFAESLTANNENGQLVSGIKTTTYTVAEIKREVTGVQGMNGIEYFKNTAGILPVNFVNAGEPGEFEGTSDLQVIFPRIQLYSEIDVKKNKVLLNTEPKLIQYVSNKTQWMENNGFTDINAVRINEVDFIINLKDKEETTFEIPEQAIENYEVAQKSNFKNIVEGSQVPEIIWGLKTEGNHASAEEQIAVFVSFVNMKRAGHDGSYLTLIDATVRLMSEAFFQPYNFEIQISWNDLDVMTELEKAKMFSDYATGMSKLNSINQWGPESSHKLLTMILGDRGIADYKKWLKDANEGMKTNAIGDLPYEEIAFTIDGKLPDMPDREDPPEEPGE